MSFGRVKAASTTLSVQSLLSTGTGNEGQKKNLTTQCRVPVYNPVTKTLPISKRYFVRSDLITADALAKSGLKLTVPAKSKSQVAKPMQVLEKLNQDILMELEELGKMNPDKALKGKVGVQKETLDASSNPTTVFYSTAKLRAHILGKIFNKVIESFTSVSESLTRMKASYHEIIDELFVHEEKNLFGIREKESALRESHDLVLKLAIMEDRIKAFETERDRLKASVQMHQEEIEQKKKVILKAAETIYEEHPRNGLTKRQFVIDWLESMVRDGLHCRDELKYLAQNPDLFRELNDHVVQLKGKGNITGLGKLSRNPSAANMLSRNVSNANMLSKASSSAAVHPLGSLNDDKAHHESSSISESTNAISLSIIDLKEEENQ